MDFLAEYRRKLTTPESAVATIAPRGAIGFGVATVQPPALLAALGARARAGDVRELAVYYTYAIAPLCESLLVPELLGVIRPRPTFLTAGDRKLIEASGSAASVDYVPANLHQIPRLFEESIALDAFLVTVSPMDRFGYLSLGTCIGYSAAAARSAKRLIVEVNERMPRTLGDTMLHVSEIDAIVEHTAPLAAFAPRAPSDVDHAIGERIAALIGDGATLQLGIGGVPDAVAACLADRRELGIHTELLTPGMMRLVQSGVVTGTRKRTFRRKHVFTLAIGDEAFYDFMHDNPALEGQPCSVTNDPASIAANDHAVSINSILEVDLYGQVNAEFLDHHEFSGVGGQHDFVRGAYRSHGGKSFLAFHSTAHGGTVSRVVPRLDGVVTDPRMDVHYLATEHGVVDLKGRSTRERAELIISIADPAFRDDLEREAKKRQLL
ncbi:MAG: acetyl-CoA hydrolase/transferase C-terminal domain-containing protein [Thermodesulfobacteriota bacterium]